MPNLDGRSQDRHKATQLMKPKGSIPILIGILMVLTLDAFAPVRARGEWIILNSGEKFQTDRSWQEDGRLKFRLNGLVVSVPESDVAQVVSPQKRPEAPEVEARPTPSKRPLTVSATANRQSKRRQRLQSALRLPPPDQKPPGGANLPESAPRQSRRSEVPDHALKDKTAAPQAPPPTPASGAPPTRTVFRDLAWGMRPNSLPGLAFSQTNPAYGGVDEFFYPEEELQLGGAPLNGIVYGFWQQRLYTITIWTDGRPSYEKLRRWVIDTYGPGQQRQKEVERRIWLADGTDRMLEFDDALNTGIFWMRSQQLHKRIMQMRAQ
jgi:hypothetical protein